MLAVLISTLVLAYSFYITTSENFTRNMVGLYFILPMLLIVLVFRGSPAAGRALIPGSLPLTKCTIALVIPDPHLVVVLANPNIWKTIAIDVAHCQPMPVGITDALS